MAYELRRRRASTPSGRRAAARGGPPRLEELPGWSESTAGVTDEAALPAAARSYLAFLEEQLRVPVVLVSTGATREETLLRRSTALGERLAALIGQGR